MRSASGARRLTVHRFRLRRDVPEPNASDISLADCRERFAACPLGATPHGRVVPRRFPRRILPVSFPWHIGCVTGRRRPASRTCDGARRLFRAGGFTLDYEIEVQELKDRRRGLSRLALGTLAAGALALVLRHLMM